MTKIEVISPLSTSQAPGGKAAAPGFEPGNALEIIYKFKMLDTSWTPTNTKIPKEKLCSLTKKFFIPLLPPKVRHKHRR